MDALMQSSTELTTSAYPTWDFVYSAGCVLSVEDDAEHQQRAEIACFMQKGAVPQIPSVGADWLAFFMKKIAFADLDAQIRQMLVNTDEIEYSPSYSASDDLLIATVQRSGQ